MDPSKSLAAGLAYETSHPIALGFDAIPSENNENENIGSTNPIEDGSFVSDHIRTNPEKATFTAIISQASLQNFLGLNGGAGRGTVLANSSDPITDAYNYIHDTIFRAKAIFDFVSGLKVYQNFFMSEFRVNRDASTGMALSCTFTIQELVFVSTQVVNAPKIPVSPNPSAPSSASPQTDLGRQSTSDATPSAQAENTQTLNDYNAIPFLNPVTIAQ